MKGSVRFRLESLEARTARAPFAPGWSREEVAEKVLDEIDFAVATDSPLDLCEGELEAIGAGGVGDLPGWLQPRVCVRPPTWGTVRHRYEEPPPFVGWRENVRRHEERVRAFEEASKQRDRELLETNRASVGLPPLTAGELTELGLEGTEWGRGDT